MKTTEIAYQVESNNGVHSTRVARLISAEKYAKKLQEQQVKGVQIARYDKSGRSSYYEIVKQLS
jgi:hypothetical protein